MPATASWRLWITASPWWRQNQSSLRRAPPHWSRAVSKKCPPASAVRVRAVASRRWRASRVASKCWSWAVGKAAGAGGGPGKRSSSKSNYTAFTLRAMMTLAIVGQRVGVDLWRAHDPEGRSLRAAVDYLVQHTRPLSSWPHPQIEPVEPWKVRYPLRMAAWGFQDAELHAAADAMLTAPADARWFDLAWLNDE